MTWHKFDYGYNMKVNLFFAGVNVVSWIVFCGFKMSRGTVEVEVTRLPITEAVV